MLGEMRVFLQEVDDHSKKILVPGDLAYQQSLQRRGEILLCQLVHTAGAADEVVNLFIPAVTALQFTYQAPISVSGDRGRPRYHISSDFVFPTLLLCWEFHREQYGGALESIL